MGDDVERQEAVDQMQVILAGDLPMLPLYYAARVVVFDAEAFDNRYSTPGGFGSGIPMPHNKHKFTVGQPEGLTIRSRQGRAVYLPWSRISYLRTFFDDWAERSHAHLV